MIFHTKFHCPDLDNPLNVCIVLPLDPGHVSVIPQSGFTDILHIDTDKGIDIMASWESFHIM